MKNFLSEDDIEQAVVEKIFRDQLRWQVLNAYTAQADHLNDGTQRTDKTEVVLRSVLRKKLEQLNPDLPPAALEQAAEILCQGRRAVSLIKANAAVYQLLREGVPVRYAGEEGKEETAFARVIDFAHPERNEFLAVRQLWIKGSLGYRRPDIILYVNGLPLVLIELKNSNVKVKNGYDDNLTNYRAELPQLFWYNVVTIISNGHQTRVGSFTAGWEHFGEWLRTTDERERPDKQRIREYQVSLDYAVLGLCTPERLVDYLENFVLYHAGTTKVIAKNHQFLGVNKAIAAFQHRQERQGKLGVFWHTQGSGKSFSMVFFTRKILRKFGGHYTFLIVTDRDDLDGQIYSNFLDMGAFSKNDTTVARPGSSEQLRSVLGQHKSYIFTLIHKFRYPKGKPYPVLSERDDIIVIVDEAHRTQYKDLAENMRTGLPNAQYIAFTGTPLLGKEKKTNQWFGDYVSEYNFAQAVDDGATVPLYYDKRVPEVQIANDDLDEELATILENEDLSEDEQMKLENTFSREMEVIKRDDRLETIARDIAYHFPRRGYLGKGMVITVDKFTAVKMYDKVRNHWKKEQKRLRSEISTEKDSWRKDELRKALEYMNRVEMAVVVSEEAGENEKFEKAELNIAPHRRRMNALGENGQTIEYNFKDADHPLHLVFVCSMWLTGFDAPTVSTLYLDKPMKNHTLMQTIARANRVAPGKVNGLVVDYYNVFRNIRQALSDYGQGEAVDSDREKQLVEDKSQLFTLLDKALEDCLQFCQEHDIDLEKIAQQDQIFAQLGLFNAFADKLLASDEVHKTFLVFDNTTYALYEACKPDISKQRHQYRLVEVIHYLRGVLDSHAPTGNIERARQRVADLLDQSVLTEDDVSRAAEERAVTIRGYEKALNLATLNVEKTKKEFRDSPYKNIQIADLRSFITEKLLKMLEENVTRGSFMERFQVIINRYNSGGRLTEDYFQDLVDFVEDLKAEDQRNIKLGLSPEELELFDLLQRGEFTQQEEQDVKNAAKHLLQRLKEEKPTVLISGWHKDTSSQLKVKNAIEDTLDRNLPKSYDRKTYAEVCSKVYDHVFVQASHGKGWAA